MREKESRSFLHRYQSFVHCVPCKYFSLVIVVMFFLKSPVCTPCGNCGGIVVHFHSEVKAGSVHKTRSSALERI